MGIEDFTKGNKETPSDVFKGHDLANMSLDEEIALTEYVISENAKEAKEEEKFKKNEIWERKGQIGTSTETKEYIYNKVLSLVRWKIKNPDEKWTQRMELNLISDHWHNFDEKTKNLMLMAVPELAAYILRDELQLTDKPVKF